MTRDKGYGGRKRNTKKMAFDENDVALTLACAEEDNIKNSQWEKDLQTEDMVGTSQSKLHRSHGKGDMETTLDQMRLLKRMQAKIEELKARLQV